jgi:hypothetical protein
MGLRALLKVESFNLGNSFKQVAREVFGVRRFCNGKGAK